MSRWAVEASVVIQQRLHVVAPEERLLDAVPAHGLGRILVVQVVAEDDAVVLEVVHGEARHERLGSHERFVVLVKIAHHVYELGCQPVCAHVERQP